MRIPVRRSLKQSRFWVLDFFPPSFAIRPNITQQCVLLSASCRRSIITKLYFEQKVRNSCVHECSSYKRMVRSSYLVLSHGIISGMYGICMVYTTAAARLQITRLGKFPANSNSSLTGLSHCINHSF